MALTAFQRHICHLLAGRRIAAGERYVAGDSAINTFLGAPRLSNDLDLFHDSQAAVATSFAADRALLEVQGLAVEVLRKVPGFVEALVRRDGSPEASTRIDWSHDSSYRYFPLVTHPELGLTLHPFDLATNKVLALVGRLEVRDWVDVLACDERLQPFGLLAWAACGKDPGFGPAALVEHASRTGRYSRAEVAALAFDGPAPDAGDLSRRWRVMLDEARAIVEVLPADQVGTCVTLANGELCRLAAEALQVALAAGEIHFHPGSVGGSLPVPVVGS